MSQNPFDDFQNKPPIPAPNGDFQAPLNSSTGLLAYLPMVGIAIVIFAILMAISFVVNILFVGVAIIAIYVVLAIFATEKMKALSAKLNYTVRNREDLQQIGAVIDLNMKLAFALLVILFPVMFVAVLKGAFICTILIMVASFSLTPYTLAAEKKFKAMKVDAFGPQIGAEFAAMLVRWKEPGFGLK